MIILYLLPINPITANMQPWILRYIMPAFYQNWHLFAPDPPTSDRTVAVRCRLSDRQPGDEDWFNISLPLIRRFQAHRLSPASRLIRPQHGVLHTATFQDQLLEQIRKKEKPDGPSELSPEEIGERKRADVLLRRLGSAACDERFGGGVARSSQVRMEDHFYPRFSGRDRPWSEGDTKHLEFPWFNYEQTDRN